MKSRVITGKIYVVADNIDTDQIIPAQYLNLVPTIPEEYDKLGSYALVGLPDEYPPFVESGKMKADYTILVAGRNFGCGSSREHAVTALASAGIRAVVAESYARIFFRNALATGELYPCESGGRLCDIFQTGDTVEVNLDTLAMTQTATGHSFQLKSLGEFGPLVEAGGIFAYARQLGIIGDKSKAESAPTSADADESGSHTKIIALSNQKGGVGKTTTAINLSAGVAASGKKVLLVDLDPQCNATSGLGVDPVEGGSVYKALLEGTSGMDLIRETQVKNLDIIPSEVDLAGAEVDVARTEGYLHKFGKVIQPVIESGKYDCVFIDCPPSLGILTMNALVAADSVLIPIQCEYYALEGLSVISRLLEDLRSSGANAHLALEGILMTMFDGRTKLSSQVEAEVRKHFHETVYRTVIPRNVRLSEAPSHGLPVMSYDKYSSGARAYKKLAKEFLKRRA